MSITLLETYSSELTKLWAVVGHAWMGMVIIADGAKDGAVQFRDLKLRYYGAQRSSQTKSTRSFNRLRLKAVNDGVLERIEGTTMYLIGDYGRAVLAYAEQKGINTSKLQSRAQQEWEQRYLPS